jgi:hypothetical protein
LFKKTKENNNMFMDEEMQQPGAGDGGMADDGMGGDTAGDDDKKDGEGSDTAAM